MMQKKTFIKWMSILTLLCAVPAVAQDVLKIEVRLAGAPTGVDENFVRSHIRLKVGDTYRSGLEDEDIKALVGTGRISNVIVHVRQVGGGVEMIYTIQRARTTGLVILKGYDGMRELSVKSLLFKEHKLRAQVSLRQNEPYSESKVAADVRALEDYYTGKGYYYAKVDARTALDPVTQKQNVTFVIKEGERVKIEEVRFRLAQAVNTIDKDTDIFTTELNHNLVTGDPVRLFVQAQGGNSADGGPAPMPKALLAEPSPDGQRVPVSVSRVARYFVRVIARNQFTLHYTAADALSGNNRMDFVGVAKVLHYVETSSKPMQWVEKKPYKSLETNLELEVTQLKEKYRDNGYLDVAVDIDESLLSFLPGSKYGEARRAWRLAEYRVGVYEKALDQVKPGESVEIDGSTYNETKLKAILNMAEDAKKDAYRKYMAARKSVNLSTLTCRVAEGRQYHVGKVEFKFGESKLNGEFVPNSALKPEVPREILASVLTLKEGEVFQPDKLLRGNEESDINKIVMAFGQRGCINARVKAFKLPNATTGNVDIVYQIDQGKPVRIELIIIEGNFKTKDFIIRRELAVSPGELFDMMRVKLSEERIKGLRLFDQVRVEEEGIEGFDDRMNLIISVKERTPSHPEPRNNKP